MERSCIQTSSAGLRQPRTPCPAPVVVGVSFKGDPGRELMLCQEHYNEILTGRHATVRRVSEAAVIKLRDEKPATTDAAA